MKAIKPVKEGVSLCGQRKINLLFATTKGENQCQIGAHSHDSHQHTFFSLLKVATMLTAPVWWSTASIK
jgi:hypothetical protein